MVTRAPLVLKSSVWLKMGEYFYIIAGSTDADILCLCLWKTQSGFQLSLRLLPWHWDFPGCHAQPEQHCERCGSEQHHVSLCQHFIVLACSERVKALLFLDEQWHLKHEDETWEVLWCPSQHRRQHTQLGNGSRGLTVCLRLPWTNQQLLLVTYPICWN